MILTLICDIGTQIWPGYCEDLHPYHNEVNRLIGSKVISKKIVVFHCHDLDLQHMTFKLKRDLDIVVTY